MRTKQELDAALWNLLGSGERFKNGSKKLNRIYWQLMDWKDRDEELKRRHEQQQGETNASA